MVQTHSNHESRQSFDYKAAFETFQKEGYLVTLAQEPTGVLVELGYTDNRGRHTLEFSQIHPDEEEALKAALEWLKDEESDL